MRPGAPLYFSSLTPYNHREDDGNWPKKNIVGKQELEIRIDNEHISFETAKIGSLADVADSADPDGLRVFYYLVQDLKVSPRNHRRRSQLTLSAVPHLFAHLASLQDQAK